MTITVELDAETEQRLADLVALSGRSLAELMPDVVKYGLEEVEDYHRAVAVAERVRRGEETMISADELRRELGLDD